MIQNLRRGNHVKVTSPKKGKGVTVRKKKKKEHQPGTKRINLPSP